MADYPDFNLPDREPGESQFAYQKRLRKEFNNQFAQWEQETSEKTENNLRRSKSWNAFWFLLAIGFILAWVACYFSNYLR